MMSPQRPDLTQLLQEWSEGDPQALEQLMPLVYEELRRLAKRYMGGERYTHTLEATALVHEVYLQLAGTDKIRWQDRKHFYAIAASFMRRILVDHARKRSAARRGGGMIKIALEEDALAAPERAADLVALDDAMLRLAEFDEQKCRIIELRYFGGLTLEETAEVMKLSPQKVWQESQIAKAWLYREIQKEYSS